MRAFGIFGVAAIAAVLWTAGNAAGQDTAAEADALPAEAPADSIAADTVAVMPTAAELAAEAYHDLKVQQYDGLTEDELYPLVVAVWRQVSGALSDPVDAEDDRPRLRAMMLDLYPTLRRATAYWSSKDCPAEMIESATACVDTHMMPEMNGQALREDPKLYPAMVYMASTGAYNKGDYQGALRYFDEYVRTGDRQYRENVFSFMGQASMACGDTSRALRIADSADDYPANLGLLHTAMQLCLDAGQNERLATLLARALELRPDDEQLLNVQAQLYEGQGDYNSALSLWLRLSELRPDNLGITRHLAISYYNLGVDYYNRSVIESDAKAQKKYSRQSNAYFQSALRPLLDVVANDPGDERSLRALAICSGCLGETDLLEQTNNQLAARGLKPIELNAMPENISLANTQVAAQAAEEVPDFQTYAQAYVERGLGEFTKRGEFERMSDYEARITPQAVNDRYVALCKEAEQNYIGRYASRLRITDMTLQPYDADNETYRIETSCGPVTVHVPLKNQEAESFKSGWSSVRVNNPQFFISDNRVAIASVDLVTGAGKTYRYRSDRAAAYDHTDVVVDMTTFIKPQARGSKDEAKSAGTVLRAKSDIDDNIPVTSRRADKTIALVVGNEHYRQVADVDYANYDAETFADYCRKTLGIPAEQVLEYKDLTLAEMLSAVSRLKPLARSMGDDVELIFYYAGHGVPDDKTRDAYLLPADADGLSTQTCYKLEQLYSDLGAVGAARTLVFLDACFSGMNREGEPLNAARAVARVPRQSPLPDNMLVLSAASDQETAMPWRDRNHGLFTYCLLKKVQQTKGNVSLRELADHVVSEVGRQSVLVNHKPQTPSVTVTGQLSQEWDKLKLRK